MADRYDYVRDRLLETDIDPFPSKQLAKWLTDARAEAVVEPYAMCLSTVDDDNRPSSRIVLLRALDEDGITFFTNYESRKGQEIAANPYACVNFWWGALERQVRVEGRLEKVSPKDSDAYWSERPLESQLASAASPQSQVVESRQALEQMVASLRQQTAGSLPRPEHWGGYLLKPNRYEFWQGGPARLHDRLVYRLEEGRWIVERLAP